MRDRHGQDQTGRDVLNRPWSQRHHRPSLRSHERQIRGLLGGPNGVSSHFTVAHRRNLWRYLASGPAGTDQAGRRSIGTEFNFSLGRPDLTANLARSLAGLYCRGSSLNKGRFFVTAARDFTFAINFDGALKICAVLDHDARGGQVPDYGTIFLDLDAITSAQIALHTSIDHHFAGHKIGCDFGAGSNGQFAVVQLNKAFHSAIHLQVLVTRNLTLDMQARSQTGGRSGRSRSQRANSVGAHDFTLHYCRSQLGCICLLIPLRSRNRLWPLIWFSFFVSLHCPSSVFHWMAKIH